MPIYMYRKSTNSVCLPNKHFGALPQVIASSRNRPVVSVVLHPLILRRGDLEVTVQWAGPFFRLLVDWPHVGNDTTSGVTLKWDRLARLPRFGADRFSIHKPFDLSMRPAESINLRKGKKLQTVRKRTVSNALPRRTKKVQE